MEQSEKGIPLSALSYIVLSILCGMMSVLCKLNTASLPGVILLVEYLLFDRTWQGWKKKIPWFSVAFSLWFLFVLYVCSGGEGLLEDVSALARETEAVGRWSYLCTQFNVIVIYIQLLFLPVGQNLDYFYQFKDGFWDAYIPLAFLLLMVIVGLGIWSRKKRPVIAFAVFWFFITLSVESSIIPIRDALFEHRLYLPMFGFALIVPYLMFNVLSNKRSLAAMVCALIAISFATATYLRNQVWKDEITMWTDVVKKAPDNYKGWNNWGDVLVKMKKHTEAIPKFKKSLSIRPDNDEAWYNWGVALLSLNKPDEAIPKFKRAIAVKQDFAEAWCNWGCALLEMGRPDEAIKKTKIALSIKLEKVRTWC